MEEVVPQNGSCVRCRRALDLAAAKVNGRWYGNAACAIGEHCALDGHVPVVPEPWLYARPQRYFRHRKPKELRGTHAELPVTYQDPIDSK